MIYVDLRSNWGGVDNVQKTYTCKYQRRVSRNVKRCNVKLFIPIYQSSMLEYEIMDKFIV